MPATAKSHDKNLATNTTDSSVSAYSQKIAKVCAMQGLPIGSTGDLGTFMRALNTDKLLAMNFWSLVVRITDQVSAQISAQISDQTNDQTSSPAIAPGPNGTLLEAIAQGITHSSVAQIEAAGGEPRWLIQQMAAMLAGEDIQIPPVIPAPAAAVPEDSSRAVVVEAPPLVLTPPAEVPAPAEIQLQPFLIRTDRTDRNEPTDRDQSDKAVVSRPLPGKRASFVPETQEEKVSPSRVPLENYGATAATEGAKKIALALLVVVALGGGTFLAHGNSAALQQKFGPSIRAQYSVVSHGVKSLGNWASRIAE